MPSETSTLNAFQAVESIRDVIADRRLKRFEQRISRLKALGSSKAPYADRDESLMHVEFESIALRSPDSPSRSVSDDDPFN